MFRILAFAALLLVASLPVSAGLKEGVEAFKRGDYRTASREFKALAGQGHAEAQFHLGLMYYKGLSVPKNYKLAVMWYRKAAEQGYASAQYKFGGMYFDGAGVPKNYREAAKWFRKAAEQGHAITQYNLGVMYEYGGGVPYNYVLAYMWYSLAAARGNKEAAKNVVLILKHMTSAQVAKAQELAAKWRPKKATRR